MLMHPGVGEELGAAVFVGIPILGKLDRPLQCYWPRSYSSGCNLSPYKAYTSQERLEEAGKFQHDKKSQTAISSHLRTSFGVYWGLGASGVQPGLGVTGINYAAGREVEQREAWEGGGGPSAHLGSHGIPWEPPWLLKRASLNTQIQKRRTD